MRPSRSLPAKRAIRKQGELPGLLPAVCSQSKDQEAPLVASTLHVDSVRAKPLFEVQRELILGDESPLVGPVLDGLLRDDVRVDNAEAHATTPSHNRGTSDDSESGRLTAGTRRGREASHPSWDCDRRSRCSRRQRRTCRGLFSTSRYALPALRIRLKIRDPLRQRPRPCGPRSGHD
jgi:hypothetical protein